MSEYIYKPPPPPPPPAPATNSSHRGRGRGGGYRGGGGGNNNNGQRGRGRGFNARGGGGGGGRGYRDPPVFSQAHYGPSFPQSPNQYGPQQQQFPMNPFHNLHTPLVPTSYHWSQQHQQPQQQQQQQQTPSYLSYSQEKTTPAPAPTSTSYKTAQSGWPATPSYAHFTPPDPQPPLPAPRARKDEKPDMDEETWLRLNGGKLLGTNLKPPETPEEIEEWIRERRRRFPTRERVAAKVKEEEEKKRKLAGASDAGAGTVRAQAPATSRQALATAQQPSQQKRKRTEQDPGNDYPSDSSLGSDADTNSQSSFPEELPTSKKPPPPSPTASTPSRKKSTKQAALCRVFRTTGKCRFGEGCRHRHVPPEGKRKRGGEGKGAKSLYQRLLDQDREEENEIVVSAVRYLFERGALSVSEAGGGK